MEIKTLNEQIERLRELIRKCYATVAGKNGTVPEVGERTMENLPAAIESIPSPVKVKLAGALNITNSCIDEDGSWAGEKVIDTSRISTFANLCRNASNLKRLDASSWDTSNVTSINNAFSGCTNLLELNTSGWNLSKVTYINNAFRDIQCEQLDTSTYNISNPTETAYLFMDARKLKTIDTCGWDLSNVTSTLYMFIRCYSLESIIGNRTIEDVINNNVQAMRGLKVANSIWLGSTILDRASLRALINGLADLTGQTSQTLALGATLIAKLTEEDIAISTSKNWTIV